MNYSVVDKIDKKSILRSWYSRQVKVQWTLRGKGVKMQRRRGTWQQQASVERWWVIGGGMGSGRSEAERTLKAILAFYC